MGRLIKQICINPETGKSVYFINYNDGILSYRVSTEPKVLNKEKVIYEGDNVIVGQFFFHKSFLTDFIKNSK